MANSTSSFIIGFLLGILATSIVYGYVPINKTGVWTVDNYTMEMSSALATAPNPILAGYSVAGQNKIVIRSGMSWSYTKMTCNHEMCHLLVHEGKLIVPNNTDEEVFCIGLEDTLKSPTCDKFMAVLF